MSDRDAELANLVCDCLQLVARVSGNQSYWEERIQRVRALYAVPVGIKVGDTVTWPDGTTTVVEEVFPSAPSPLDE